ncbi:hypothetical protein HU200_010207 [Digitaria exilis]|uniref:Spindle and kinetochore-associated protein 1 n=1 Tax=Digitaria exilis TaxID=1010633 RepID=A0A835FHC3_9POAL|nr:hypothetical protein HU200_010207 [Digitaria exilis]
MDACDGSPAASPLEVVAAAFKSRVGILSTDPVPHLPPLFAVFPATALPDLASVDASVTAMESQVQDIRRHLQEELDAIPKAKKLIQRSLKQQEKLQHMLANLPSGMREDVFTPHLEQSSSSSSVPERELKIKEEPVAAPKNSLTAEKKGRTPAPRWYMRGRLTLEKVNIAINEVASYADSNAHLVTCPKKKLSEEMWDKALELRDIAATEAVKGKPFFLEVDIKGPGLKLDHTGKAILTVSVHNFCCLLNVITLLHLSATALQVLRHLGRIHETRIGPHRVFLLSKQA